MSLVEVAPVFIAIGSLSSAVIGCVSVGLAWRAYRANLHARRPDVRVTVRNDPKAVTLIVLEIKNVGLTTAFKVRFELDKPLPMRAFGTSEATAMEPETYDLPAPFLGIPALSAGDTRVVLWGQYWGLENALGDDVIKCTTSCEDSHGRSHESISYLEVKSHCDTLISTGRQEVS